MKTKGSIDRSIDHSPRDYRSKWETEIGQQIDCGHVFVDQKERDIVVTNS